MLCVRYSFINYRYCSKDGSRYPDRYFQDLFRDACSLSFVVTGAIFFLGMSEHLQSD